MNIRGIELMRSLGLPGPRKEVIFRDISKIDLDYLYEDATRDVTIVAFDYSEPIFQNPLFEKNVRKYEVPKEEYFKTLESLSDELLSKGVNKDNLIFLTHQTYLHPDIAYSGRAAVDINENGFGSVMVDAIESLRKANSDFDVSFVYTCPVIGGRVFRSHGEVLKKDIDFPQDKLNIIIKNLFVIPDNPVLDFEVYRDNNQLFYHDMFLASKRQL